jgi:hypothetical protein
MERIATYQKGHWIIDIAQAEPRSGCRVTVPVVFYPVAAPWTLASSPVSPLFDGEGIVVGLELGLQSAIARMARVNRVRDAKQNPLRLGIGFVVDRELQRLSKSRIKRS